MSTLKILFATDGSVDAAAAGRLLEAWPLSGRAEVMALTVVPPIALFSSALISPTSAGWAEVPEIVERESETASGIAEAAAAGLRERGVAVQSVIRHGSPAEEILKAVGEFSSDVVVLGSHGQSRLTQLLIGSVSQNVARHASCSALVVRDGAPAQGRLLLAVDGSPESEPAVRLLARLPLPAGTECTVLHVLEPLLDPTDPRAAQRLAAAEHLVETTAATLANAGYQAVPRVQEGHAAQEILRISREIDASLVAVGARGLTGLREFLLGSVSGRVLRYAPCSVLIAR
jgi:nucleotide-binding universal stress UspA family protein